MQLAEQLLAIFHCGVVGFVVAEPTGDRLVDADWRGEIDVDRHGPGRRSLRRKLDGNGAQEIRRNDANEFFSFRTAWRAACDDCAILAG